jgi:hypothetical protein
MELKLLGYVSTFVVPYSLLNTKQEGHLRT